MASTLGGEAHFFEESMNATKVRRPARRIESMGWGG